MYPRALLLLFLALSLLPLQAQETYLDSKNHFTLQVPSDWSKSSNKSYCLVLSRGPAQLYVATARGINIPDTVKKLNAEYRKSGGKLLEDTGFTINQVPAHMSAWKVGADSLISVVAVVGQEGYLFLGAFPQGSTRTDVNDVVEIIKSFRYTTQAAPVAKDPPTSDPYRDYFWDGFPED